ncbi:hypothetical protein niasHT_001172 [Heterodera trifolii]|uniref:AAA+ ATPase domain-containing protein n=1 Tax=Heterodera trifolii TaxID=157864 RepID=A0ABD2LYR5_9BILA
MNAVRISLVIPAFRRCIRYRCIHSFRRSQLTKTAASTDRASNGSSDQPWWHQFVNASTESTSKPTLVVRFADSPFGRSSSFFGRLGESVVIYPVKLATFTFFIIGSVQLLRWYFGIQKATVNTGGGSLTDQPSWTTDKVEVTFDDLRGLDEAKVEVKEIVDFLTDPRRYTSLGVRLPKGVLFVGPSGTDKMLLARAIAGEVDGPFFHAIGSEFDKILVGHFAKRIRELFSLAKENQHCFVFSDEIDSVGSKRANDAISPHANQTINQPLAEMDGFEQNQVAVSQVPPQGEEPQPSLTTMGTDQSAMGLYKRGLEMVQRGEVRFRKSRAESCECESEQDFAAKLYGVRLALCQIMDEPQMIQWLIQSGRIIIAHLLRHDKKEPSDFFAVYDRMIAFLLDNQNSAKICEELKLRRIDTTNLWDVLFDMIILDAFEDMQKLPSAVTALLRNGFISTSMKQSTVDSLIWSMTKAKRQRLQVKNGFISHFYDISQVITGSLTMGLLGGSDKEFQELCVYFKEQVCAFVVDIFNPDKVRFTTVEHLTEDVKKLLMYRIDLIKAKLATDFCSFDCEQQRTPLMMIN